MELDDSPLHFNILSAWVVNTPCKQFSKPIFETLRLFIQSDSEAHFWLIKIGSEFHYDFL